MTTDQELAQAVAEANKPMAEALKRIERSLRVLTCVELAKMLYSYAELGSLLADYHSSSSTTKRPPKRL